MARVKNIFNAVKFIQSQNPDNMKNMAQNTFEKLQNVQQRRIEATMGKIASKTSFLNIVKLGGARTAQINSEAAMREEGSQKNGVHEADLRPSLNGVAGRYLEEG